MKKNNLYALIELLLVKAESLGLIRPRDIIFLRNQFYFKFNLEAKDKVILTDTINDTLTNICKNIVKSLDKNTTATLGANPDIIEANIINTLLPTPTVIESKFSDLLKQTNIETALNWYYEYSYHTNYIKLEDIDKNISWHIQTKFGDLDITINRCKPEKDPLDIAWIKIFETKHPHRHYPRCLLCIENEGFSGSISHPSRFTHRLLEMKLDHNPWFFQYSPYSYYNQHAIIINLEHNDMIINQQMFKNFFSFVDQVPHYIIGSNCDIPIVGGSILTHDHYQAGYHIFPFEKATIKFTYKLKQFSKITLNYLNWPVSTLQLIGNKQDLLAAADIITNSWYIYNDEKLHIISHTRSHRHNGITPILRKAGRDKYYLYIMLRNNRTSHEYPDGIFHPHQSLHHIKKENIGLIEAMGLAVLPGRLFSEINELKTLLLLNNKELAITELLFDKNLLKHEDWLSELYTKYGTFDSESIDLLLKTEIGLKFCQVLEDAGVYKNNKTGDDGIMKFLETISDL